MTKRNDRIWGIMDSETPSVLWKCVLLGTAFFCWGAALLSVILAFSAGVHLLVIALVCVVLGFPFYFLYRSYYRRWKRFSDEVHEEENQRKAAARAAFQQEHPHYEDEQFFLQCKKAGIEQLSDSADIARLLLFAKNNNISGTDQELTLRFNRSKAAVEAAEKEKRVAELQQKEAAIIEANTRYMDLVGTDKCIRMCLDNAAPQRALEAKYDAQYSKLLGVQTKAMQNANERELDWATLGGIADGLAGGAAGISAAVDAQLENMEIRDRNAARQKAYMEYFHHLRSRLYDKLYAARKEAEKWESIAEKTKSRLTATLPETELLEKLAPSVTKQQRSETGAMVLGISITPTRDLVIYDRVPAVINGSLKILLHDGNKVVGEAIYTLPHNGSEYSITFAKAVCPDTGKSESETYEISFEPIHLWALEK